MINTTQRQTYERITTRHLVFQQPQHKNNAMITTKTGETLMKEKEEWMLNAIDWNRMEWRQISHHQISYHVGCIGNQIIVIVIVRLDSRRFELNWSAQYTMQWHADQRTPHSPTTYWCDVMWCDGCLMWRDVTWCDVMWRDVMWCDVMWCDVMWSVCILEVDWCVKMMLCWCF